MKAYLNIVSRRFVCKFLAPPRSRKFVWKRYDIPQICDPSRKFARPPHNCVIRKGIHAESCESRNFARYNLPGDRSLKQVEINNFKSIWKKFKVEPCCTIKLVSRWNFAPTTLAAFIVPTYIMIMTLQRTIWVKPCTWQQSLLTFVLKILTSYLLTNKCSSEEHGSIKPFSKT